MLKRFLTILVFIYAFVVAYSQEKVVGLSDNPALQGINQKSLKLKSAELPDTLELPFLDDFSGSQSPYPRPEFWEDKDAFINSTYGYNPLSIGIATLDALDQNGQVYSNASESNFDADYLTSKPINLALPVNSNVFLSFYYQPQGLGDSPEAGDSLMVDFYNPVSKIWSKVWAIPGSKLQAFRAAIIPVAADTFLVKGFRFRFHNRASIDNNEFVPGKMGNVDHWHIDYVKLGANRNDHDTIMTDIALNKPATSLLKTYQSMPWKQFQKYVSDAVNPNLYFYYRNNDIVGHHVDYRYFYIKDLHGTYKNTIQYGGEDIASLSDSVFSGVKIEYSFFTNETDSADFLIKKYIDFSKTPLSGNILENDTSSFTQKFSNYYAYDDGTPEYGYGLEGSGTGNGKVAYRFNTYMQDTLTAVNIFFNSTKEDLSKEYGFRLTVWNASTNSPSSEIYQSDVLYPVETGKFYTYKLETPVLVDGDFYVGWEQTGEDFLNVGLDVNNFAMANVYYNLGSWKQSALTFGALMIRPAFGAGALVTNTQPDIENEDFSIYPNPCSETLNIERSGGSNGSLHVSLLSITGRTVLQSDISASSINLGHLPSGLYYIVITEKGKTVYKGKIIVQH
jgi:hypothetical protein